MAQDSEVQDMNLTVYSQMLAEQQIRQLRQQWAFTRDRGDWPAMASCFHPDAIVSLSWYSGPVDGLIERLKVSDALRKQEEHSKHWLGNSCVRINEDRALLETDVMILMREYIDDSLFDYVSYCRFFDQVEKRDGQWRISRWTCAFDKDRLDAVLPGSSPAWLSEFDLHGPGSGFAFMRLRQEKKGRSVPSDTILGGSAAEKAMREHAESWLLHTIPNH